MRFGHLRYDGGVALSGYKTKTDIVYESLREAILAGRYASGSRLNIDELAGEFGTSKVPIREAIGRLVGEGLLQANPHVGWMIPELSVEEILETSVIRAVVEGAAVRFSVEELSHAAIQHLKTLLTRMDQIAIENAAEYPKLNFEFHAATFAPCRFETLKSTATSLLDKTRRLGTVHFLPLYLPTAQKQHWKLFQALEQRDAKKAEAIIRHHVEQSGRLLARYASNHANTAEAANKNG